MPRVPKNVDPYRGVGRAPEERAVANTDTADRMEKTRPALTARARKRLDSITFDGEVWTLEGMPKLGDTYDEYQVRLPEGSRKYDCSCHHTQHGESRARKVCSHVMAVILWKKENPDWSTRRGSRVDEGSRDDEVTTLDAEPDGKPDIRSEQHLSVGQRVSHEAWSPDDPRLTEQMEPPPAWVESYRQTQWDAALETVEAFNNGAKVVFVDAPTGSGKTLFGDLVARMMRQPAIYMCTTKTLQDQVLEDFPYARVLKGRANYPTMNGVFPDVTADDCDGNIEADNCTYCQPMHACPYRRAKAMAIRSQLAVVNVAYWLREANFVGAFSLPPDPEAPAGNTLRPGARRRREGGLFIVDECDTLEDQLLGFVEFSLTSGRLRQLGLAAPKKSVHKATVQAWMDDELVPALLREKKRYESIGGLEGMRRARGLATLAQDAESVSAQLADDNWIRDYSGEERGVPFAYKPVRVDGFGGLIWNNIGRAVMMSATIISPEEMARTLGLDGEYAVVRMPMTFPIEHRVVNRAPVARMTREFESTDTPKLMKAIDSILERHPGERVLIHTVSYARAKTIETHLTGQSHRHGRTIISYANATGREQALERYLRTDGAVMVAPSFERGIDLKDDACRVQIVAKIPYPFLGDPRVNKRQRQPDGDAWYAVQTIRSLVQMTGRAVRTADDYCTTYILDAQFGELLRRSKSLIPAWWSEAINSSFPVRELL